MNNSETKEYSFIGRVEIGTDEYRALIEGLADARHEAQKSNSDYWTQYRKANDLEAQLKDLRAKFDELRAFVDADESVATKLQLFRLQKMQSES